MSFSEATLRNKLDSLDETQDSIVSTSQWILFYYRHSDKIVNEWDKYLRESLLKKKLPLIYLANDVVQQARAKKRVEFIESFGKVLPSALTFAYNNVPEAIKQKIIKIVKIWKQRRIFPKAIEIEGAEGVEDGAPSNSSSRSISNNNTKTLTTEEKLKGLSSTSQKFNSFYHEILVAAHTKFSPSHIEDLQRLISVSDETILQLQELKDNVNREINVLNEKDTVTKQKKLELEQRQQELEELRKQQELKVLEDLTRQKEEENLLPTYEEGSDSDSSDESDNESKDNNNTEKATHEEASIVSEPPAKRLRFAE